MKVIKEEDDERDSANIRRLNRESRQMTNGSSKGRGELLSRKKGEGQPRG